MLILLSSKLLLCRIGKKYFELGSKYLHSPCCPVSVNSCVSTIHVLELQAYSSMTDLYFAFVVVSLDQLHHDPRNSSRKFVTIQIFVVGSVY